jgi:1-pyrroline-5-carboxylate dehydrogenase
MYWIFNECGTLNCLCQILTEYKDEDLPLVLEACERMHAHLTAAVVSNDVLFLQVMKISLFPVLT